MLEMVRYHHYFKVCEVLEVPERYESQDLGDGETWTDVWEGRCLKLQLLMLAMK